MNKKEFEAEMKKHGDTQSTLAEALGIRRTTLNNKLHERYNRSFTQSEMTIIRNRYNLDAKQIELIFFKNNVS